MVLLRHVGLRGSGGADPQRGATTSLRDVAGESLILVGGDRGELYAFYNVCRHRGTRLSRTSGSIRVHDPVSLSRLDLRSRRPAGRRAAHGPGGRFPRTITRLSRDGPRLGWTYFLNFGEVRPSPGPARRAWTSGFGPGDGGITGCGADRLRRRGELEADHPQLLGVPPLPGGPPGVAEALALPQRRERARGRRLPGGRMGLRQGIATLSMDGRTRWDCLPGSTQRMPGRLLLCRLRTSCSACTRIM